MRIISSFQFISLDGYFEGSQKGDINWHRHGGEESDFAAEGAKSESILLFGRVTYEMMASYWPTPVAAQNDPAVAEGMNKSEKIVFSRTLKNTSWQNTRIISGNIVEEIRKIKTQPGKDMTLLGSGSILTQFADAGLIDVFQIMLDPVALGAGNSLFKGLTNPLNLELTNSRIFKSGTVLLTYTSTRRVAPDG